MAQSKGLICLLERPLREVGLHALHAHAQADVNAGGRVLPGAVLVSGQNFVAIEQVFEIATILLEAGCVDVRQIVGDRIKLCLQRIHAGRCGVQGLKAHDRFRGLSKFRVSECLGGLSVLLA